MTIPEANKTHDVLSVKNAVFSWKGAVAPTLRIARFLLGAGESIFISGPSGSGKSTFLQLLAGIIVPQQGQVYVMGRDLALMSGRARDAFRVDHMGFIFQQFNLIPYLTILENVLLPCRFSRLRADKAEEQAMRLAGKMDVVAAAEALLTRLDLDATLWGKRVTSLSIGQQQRVAAARALIGAPDILIADEPTSALDADRQKSFLTLLQNEAAVAHSALVFVSHDSALGEIFNNRTSLAELNAEPCGVCPSTTA